MVASPCRSPGSKNPPAPPQTSLDLGEADGRVPRVPVAKASDVDGALRELFGFAGFRPGQREAVEAARDGRDVLVVMPTGSGKSLCYQLPALMRTDLTLVVSPLVSLMQDQVEALERVAPGRVALVNAQQDSRDEPAGGRRARWPARCGCSTSRRSASPRRASWSASATPDRPVRGRRGALRVAVGARLPARVLPARRRRPLAGRGGDPGLHGDGDARGGAGHRARLGLREPVHVATGFDRPNLSFAVVPCPNKDVVHRRIAAALSEPDALPAIVYAGTRAECDRLADRLGRELGVEVIAYHAGLPRDARAEAQRRFMAGEAPVVVATNAFGMGVDKADVRTVCHESVPSSIEAYYQEAGRAGRDGKPARCLLFATGSDKGLHVFFIERSAVGEDAAEGSSARRIVRACAKGEPPRYDIHIDEFLERGDEDAMRAVVGYLARAGVIQPAPSAPDKVAGRVVGAWDARRARASARPPPRRARACAGASTAPCGRGSRAAAAAAPGSCATSATARSPRPTVPCCDVCDPELVAGAPARRAARRARSAAGRRDLDGAILDIVATAQPGGRAHARGGDPPRRALEGDREALLRRAAELRRLPGPARRGGAGRDRRPARRRHAALDRRALPETRAGQLEVA